MKSKVGHQKHHRTRKSFKARQHIFKTVLNDTRIALQAQLIKHLAILLREAKLWHIGLPFLVPKLRLYRRQTRSKRDGRESVSDVFTRVVVLRSRKARNSYEILKPSQKRLIVLHRPKA